MSREDVTREDVNSPEGGVSPKTSCPHPAEGQGSGVTAQVRTWNSRGKQQRGRGQASEEEGTGRPQAWFCPSTPAPLPPT